MACPRGGPKFSASGHDRVLGTYGKPELKFFDTTISDPFSAAGLIANVSLNFITQGTGESQRIGRRCTILNISMRYVVDVPSVTATNKQGALCRMIVYLDTQCNGTSATVLDILTTAEWNSFYNVANKSRFEILLDENFVINQVGGAPFGTGNFVFARVIKHGKWSKVVNIPLEFSAATASIADIKSNNIGLLLIHQFAEDEAPGVTGKVRIRYTG